MKGMGVGSGREGRGRNTRTVGLGNSTSTGDQNLGLRRNFWTLTPVVVHRCTCERQCHSHCFSARRVCVPVPLCVCMHLGMDLEGYMQAKGHP